MSYGARKLPVDTRIGGDSYIPPLATAQNESIDEGRCSGHSEPLSYCKSMTWREAADLPLCLLTRNMQNRRIIDAAFRRASAHPSVVVETDSVFALYSNVRCSEICSIMPHSLLALFEMREELTAIPLTPQLTRGIGLVALDSHPVSPIVSAVWSISTRLDLDARFDFVETATA